MIVREADAGGRLTIDLTALADNYRLLARAAAPAECAAVVKANGYGLSVERVVPVLLAAGARTFFVAHVAEAAEVAPLLPEDAVLYVLNGPNPGSGAAFVAAGARPVLNSIGQARRWQAFAEDVGQPLPAALQIDSGMTRLGLDPAEVPALAADPAFRAAVPLTLAMSHLACGDEPAAAANAAQRAAFLTEADLLPGVPRALANSGGTLMGGGFALDMVRVGIGLYGSAPGDPAASPMRPVIRLDARVIQLRDVPAGVAVGYGLTWTAQRPTRLATLGVGYADGWPRSLGNVGAAWAGGVRLPIVGRVSMDSMMVDVTDLGAPPAEGDWLQLIGPDAPIDRIAADAGTIAYELLTQLGRRFHVEVIEN